MPPITSATFAKVEVLQNNVMLVFSTAMDLAFRSMGSQIGAQMGAAMEEIGTAIGEALEGAMGSGESSPQNKSKGKSAEPKAVTPPQPAEPTVAELTKMIARARAGTKEDEDQKAAFMKVMNEDEGRRCLDMPGKHLAGLPSLLEPRSDADLAAYCEMHLKQDPRWGAFMSEFMAMGGEISQRIQRP